MTLTTADLKKLATKSDLRKLATRSELQSTRSELQSTRSELQSTRGELKAEIKRVDDDILSFKNEVDEKLEKHQKRTENLIKKFTNKIINHINAFLAELTNARFHLDPRPKRTISIKKSYDIKPFILRAV